MTWLRRLFGLFLMIGLTCPVQADPGDEIVQKKRSAKPPVSSIKQQDGSIVMRLDLDARQEPPKTERVPATPEEWLSRMLDPTRNGLVLKHPRLFAEWLDAVTEPRFMTALATVALDPNSYSSTFSRLLDPATARNWTELMDAEVFMRWMAAGMDPELYQAVFQHMFDPKKYLRWTNYPGSLAEGAMAPVGARQGERMLRERPAGVDATASETWRQLAPGRASANPWLIHRDTYRY